MGTLCAGLRQSLTWPLWRLDVPDPRQRSIRKSLCDTSSRQDGQDLTARVVSAAGDDASSPVWAHLSGRARFPVLDRADLRRDGGELSGPVETVNRGARNAEMGYWSGGRRVASIYCPLLGFAGCQSPLASTLVALAILCKTRQFSTVSP